MHTPQCVEMTIYLLTANDMVTDADVSAARYVDGGQSFVGSWFRNNGTDLVPCTCQA